MSLPTLCVDLIRATPEASIEYEVRGTATRPSINSSAMRWEVRLPTMIVMADSPEEAKMTYAKHVYDEIISQINDQVALDEIRIHTTAYEVGHTAPYSYGDYATVQVTSDHGVDTWVDVMVSTCTKHEQGRRWMVEVIHGWVGENGLIGRVWCDDEGFGPLIQQPIRIPQQTK